MEIIGLVDWGIWLVYLVLISLMMYFYKSSKKNQKIYRYFIPAFFLKVAGGVAFVLVYVYYYGFGDTFLYHNGASVLADVAASSPGDYFRLLLSENGKLPEDLSDIARKVPYSRTSQEWFMVKLLSPLDLISFNSYLVTTLFTSIISFFGGWKLFLVFSDIFKQNKKIAFFVVFMLPSVVFWGSGILKDSVSLAAINVIIYCCYFLFFKNEMNVWRIVLLFISLIFLYQLKPYILFAFLPAIAVAFYAKIKLSIKSKVFRYMLTPVMIGILIVTAYGTVTKLVEVNTEYDAAGLERQARGFHTWHKTTGGSVYNLGEIDYTVSGVVQKIPAALNVTFFRPYLWESNNIVMVVSAVESLVLFVLFLMAVYRWKLKLFGFIRKRPFVQGLLFFSIIFGFSVGFTSYNFGALVRYKIPLFSVIFFIVLYLIYLPKSSDTLDG